MKRMKEGLRVAADIREKLGGRHHSDSTELVAEDRIGTASDSDADPELTLKDLLANVTRGNEHGEIDWGPQIGKEEW